MHVWGDKNVDWEGIEDAADFIHDYCVKWARLGGQAKEKYGEIRFYAEFGLSLHSLCYPGYHSYRFPKWLISFDLYIFTPAAEKLFGKLWFKWQKKVYSDAYLKAIKKYPHLRAEILRGADWVEYIKGVTRREENKLVILGWNNEEIGAWTSL